MFQLPVTLHFTVRGESEISVWIGSLKKQARVEKRGVGGRVSGQDMLLHVLTTF
ncbi:hypothetical protein [Desulfonatronum thioautotrophicum]|uniref:hypothetical protein n=1 Tax=Desulfonatronum thioautotrophicum TaxID=617001 RepID=UPI0012948630|nr:hypothetical protein [Desulfonatronum thioautotrophicum]